MSSPVATTLQATKDWPVADQVELLHGIWKRLVDSGWQPELTDELKAELDRRLDDLDAHPEKLLTQEEFSKRLRLPQ
jgi:putative addiction module component (TIGR02574 family)